MSSVPSKLYFIANAASVYDALSGGIWKTTPLNNGIKPIAPTSVLLVNNAGEESPATDVKIRNYVRLFASCVPILKEWKGNLASLFILEINGNTFTATRDMLRVRGIMDGQLSYLKNYWVDSQRVVRVHTYTKKIEKELRSALRPEVQTPVVTTPALFSEETLEVDDAGICISKSEKIEPPIASSSNEFVTFIKGNLLDSHMQTLVNTVNCVGVMGKGIALAFKRHFPEMFKEYHGRCRKKEVVLGKPYIFNLITGKKILNFPTKDHWKENSKIEDIEAGLTYFVERVSDWGITSIAIPPLGCGNGNLSWNDVQPLILKHLKPLGIPVEVYVPQDVSSFRPKKGSSKRKHSSQMNP